MRNLAILGGTFDPVHLGHLYIAKAIQSQCHFSSLLFLPSQTPVHKTTRTSALHRVEMLRIALEENPIEQASICLEEVNRDTPSYTVDTLNQLRKQTSSLSITWIIGWDAFLTLPEWHQFSELLTLTHLLVVKRPHVSWSLSGTLKKLLQAHQTDDLSTLKTQTHGNIYFFDAGMHDISSSLIRERIQQHQSIEDLVPAGVEDYIRRFKLYLL